MAEPLILTTIGLAKLASATPEDQLHIADVAVGDGNGGYPPLDPSMTALVHEVWRGTASAPIRDPDNDAVLIFETIIPPEDGGFFIREVGLFDADGDLIAIGQTGLVEKPSGGSGTPMTMTVRVRLALANASQTNLIINDAPYIDHQALTNRSANNAHPISSITGLQGALDGKLAIVQNLADLDDVATARSNLGLGTAAVANVTTSSTDTTAGRVLRVGDFGLGAISPPLVTDLNDALANGIYRFLETAANIPPPPATGADGALFVFGQVPTNPNSLFGHLTQIAVMRATGDFWVRSADGMDSNGDIEWGEWKNLWFNVATTSQAQALTDDTTIITPNKLGDAMNAHVLGMGQTWQDMLASRAPDTNYTNTTGRPIAVSVSTTNAATGGMILQVDGVVVSISALTSGADGSVFAIVPNGSVYRVTGVSGPFTYWAELR